MLFSVILLIILILINGIFSASELAFLSIDKFKLEEEIKNGNNNAIMIKNILSDSSTFLSTIQIGITLAGFLASAFAADYFVDYFLGVITINFLSLSVLRSILLIVVTLLLSYFTLVFGELVPKKLAMNSPFIIASKFVKLINIVRIVFSPLVKILTKSTEIMCKVLNIKEINNELTEEDIKKMIVLGGKEGVLEEREKDYILNIFDFNDIEVKDVMTPKDDVILLNIDDNIKNILLKIRETKYSRFPVFKDNQNNIIGILNVKDLILKKKDKEDINLNSVIRPVHKVSSNEKVDDVFRYMQDNNEGICIVYDSEFSGIVTIEDAVEEIVGQIYDEYN